MFLGPPNPALRNKSYDEAYSRILAQHRRSPMTSASSVIVFVAPDVDALCASKMLADLLKQDDILHRIIPVSGIAELERWRDDLYEYKEVCLWMRASCFAHWGSLATYFGSSQHGGHPRSTLGGLVRELSFRFDGPYYRFESPSEFIHSVWLWRPQS
jgi:hypothetical protein